MLHSPRGVIPGSVRRASLVATPRGEPVFTKTVPYDDGTSETFKRRERPFVYTNEKGEVIALFTACMPKDEHARMVVQPVKNYYPGN